MEIQDLPTDCLHSIFNHCPEYVPIARQVCTKWNSMSKSHKKKFDFEVYVKNNNVSLIQWMHQEKPFTHGQIDKILSLSARYGNETLMILCKEWGATDFDRALEYATLGGHIECMKLCKEWGATNFNEAISAAVKRGHLECIKLCLEWGATNLAAAMNIARRNNDVECIRILSNYTI